MTHDKDIEQTPYNVVFEHFLGGISDPDFALYTNDILEEQMVYLLKVLKREKEWKYQPLPIQRKT